MPHDEVTEERHPLASSEEEVEAFRADFERGEHILERRGACSSDGRRRGDRRARAPPCCSPSARSARGPGEGLKTTPYRRAACASSPPTASRCAPADLATDGVHHRVPRGPHRRRRRPDAAHPARPSRFKARARVGRTGPSTGIVAYSKLCTHVGCPVGLYQADEHLLLCPCHQSTFDVLDGARPVFGPAARSLPQLPARRGRRRLRSSPTATSRTRPAPASGTAIADDRRPPARATASSSRAGGPLDRRPRSASAKLRPHRARQGLPRPLVVHDRRARPLLLRRAGRSPAPTSRSSSTRARAVVTYHGSYAPLRGVQMSRPTTRPSTSASTCGPAWSCARSTTGPRCCSSPPSSSTSSASSSPAPSAGPASSTG